MNKKYMMLAALCGFAAMAVKPAANAANSEEVFESFEGVVTTPEGLHLTVAQAEQLMALVKRLGDKAEQAELKEQQAKERARVAADQNEQTEELLRKAIQTDSVLEEKNRIIKQLTEKLQRSEAQRNAAEALVASLEGQLSKTEKELQLKTTDLKKVLGVLATIDQEGEQAAIEADNQKVLMEQAQEKIKALEAKHAFMEKALLEQQQQQQAKTLELEVIKNKVAETKRKEEAIAKKLPLFGKIPGHASGAFHSVQVNPDILKQQELEEVSVQVSAQVVQIEQALADSKQQLEAVTQAFMQVQEQNQKLAQEVESLAEAKKESDVALDAFKAGFENMTKEEMEALQTEIEAFEAGQLAPAIESDDQKTITFDDIKRSFLRFLLGTKKINPTGKS